MQRVVVPLRQKLPGRLRRRYDIWEKEGKLRQRCAADLARSGSFASVARLLTLGYDYVIMGFTPQEIQAVYYILWKRAGFNISDAPLISPE